MLVNGLDLKQAQPQLVSQNCLKCSGTFWDIRVLWIIPRMPALHLQARVAMLERELYWAQLTIQKRDAQIQLLEERLRRQRIQVLGPHSETLSDLQLELLAEQEPSATVEEVQAEARREPLAAKTPREHKPHPGRKPLPENLPRQEQVIRCEPNCQRCGSETSVIGYDESEQLDHEPVRWFVRVIKREKRACAKCSAIAMPALEPRIVEKGLATDRVVVDTVVAKYCDHLPLYRQQLMLEREAGVEISRATLDGWVMRVGCWAHARRKFVDAVKVNSNDPEALKMVLRMDALFVVDREAPREHWSPDQRLAMQREDAESWAQEIHDECVKLRATVLPKSVPGQAVSYALHQWERLRRCFDYAEVELSNNLAENSMRPVALGRKNWLHVGSAQSGPKVAAILSVVESCRRLGVPVRPYLLAVLPGMANRKLAEVALLTPARWAAVRL